MATYWYCANCDDERELSVHGRCATCDSQQVMPTEGTPTGFLLAYHSKYLVQKIGEA